MAKYRGTSRSAEAEFFATDHSECVAGDCDKPPIPDLRVSLCVFHAVLVQEDLSGMRLASAMKAAKVLQPVPAPEWMTPHLSPLRPATRRAVVYYVRFDKHIKIGTTNDIAVRMRGMSIHPDSLLAIEPGSVMVERKRHNQFGHLRQGRTELFHPAEDLLEHIKRVRSEHGDPWEPGPEPPAFGIAAPPPS